MSSHTQILKEHVITACEACLASVDNTIQHERDKLITNEMNKWIFPAKTRDKAIQRLASGSHFSPYNMIEFSLSWGRESL